MPIGKNAIKRVSTVNASTEVNAKAVEAVVAEPKAEEVALPAVEVAPVEEKKPAPKKTTVRKTAPKKSMETEPDLSPVKTAEKATKKCAKAPKNEGISHFYLGDELPYYLL